MPKSQKKTGKGRLDKYYKLAKEQGYRARSAFKLIQLNKKYSFLETSRCCIDLCAAPGGWLQVASKQMPANSIIVGVDLVPIKPIPRVVTFAADITTPRCRNLIRGELKDWKADVVLHDGAPNVGTAWVQDAYSQSELVLMSLKLAVEFLIKGGTFVTKVFRSADYNNLIWVFNQLFAKVEATKPPSSRNVSAEIFVVCRDFLAPKVVDPKFLDPKHVFKDLSASVADGIDKGASVNNVHANVFQPTKSRRKRDGYTDGDYTLFKAASVSDFIRSPDPISILGAVNKLTFSTDEERQWLARGITTDDVKVNCDDLKVLGKGDFKTLIKWRLALREELGLDEKNTPIEELTETAQVTDGMDDEHQIQEELERLNAESAARLKRERRRANEIRARTLQRMQLQMTAPLDIGLEQQDPSLSMGQEDVFGLDSARTLLKHGGRLLAGSTGSDSDDIQDNSKEPDSLDPDDDEDKRVRGLEAELDGLYDAYQGRLRERDAKFKVKEARKRNVERDEWHGIQTQTDSEDERNGSEIEGGWDRMEEAKDADDTSSSDEDEEVSAGMKRAHPHEDRSSKRARVSLARQANTAISSQTKIWFSQDIFADMDPIGDIGSDSDQVMDVDEQDETDHDSSDDAIKPSLSDDTQTWDVRDVQDDTSQARINSVGLTHAETVTLAQQLVNRERTRTQLINDGFNRYSLNAKDGLPSWFLDDESKHYKPNIPITKEAVAALRAKQRALDARPIKKVAEAKARKKFKAAQRLEKAMKKAEGVNATADLSEREKAQQIEKLLRRGMSSRKNKKEVKVVVAKGVHKGLKGRPKGVKGHYLMVDSRMKKEVRAKKRRESVRKKR